MPGSRVDGPPSGKAAMPISNWPSIARSRLAKGMSHASANSLPAPSARPRIAVMVTAGELLSRMSTSIYGCSPVAVFIRRRSNWSAVRSQWLRAKIRVGAVEQHDRHVLVSDHWRVDEVDRRVVERDPPQRRRG